MPKDSWGIYLICLISIFMYIVNLVTWTQLVCVLAITLVAWHHDHLLTAFRTLPRDITFVKRLFAVLLANRKLMKSNATPASMLSALAKATPDKPCFIFRDQTWTFRQMDELSWRVANYFSELGLVHGDVVALMCTNRPEYVAIWLGLSRLGVVTALINTNLRHDALKHSLSVANPLVVITSSTLCQAIRDVRDVLDDYCKLFRICGDDQPEHQSVEEPGFELLDKKLANAKNFPIEGLPPPKYHDKLLYIYTSGTTGFPKAAVLLNSRYLFATVALKIMLPVYPHDRIYNPLPLYHTAGGLLGVGPAICFGITVCMREKFSASSYWKECAENNCTIGQYIGEMCRYLLAIPPSSADLKHNVRLMVGNGLKTAIWEQFVNRFGIEQVVELYGATEGNVNIVNVDGTIGAVGFLPNLIPHSLFPIALVKVDEDTGELIRGGPDNLCIRCKPGEPGMLVGKITEGDATREFHGYVDKTASTKKVAHNVFAVGDKAFISGDILVMDEKSYMYFKDRTGDTFRWKGENVATAEVEAAISNAIGLRDACVYGVEVPGTEGRAGMATILDPDNSVDLSALGQALAKSLPPYAQPMFLRVAKVISLTGTYKLKKVDLQKEGFNPELINDRLYFNTNGKGVYAELTKSLYDDIMNGKVRV